MSEHRENKEPKLNVGIISGKEIRFIFNKAYKISASDQAAEYCGEYIASIDNGKVRFQDNLFDELEFVPVEETGSSFELPEVIIGIDFHWERKESQTFEGNLRFIVENDKLTAVNGIPLESYLTSVISSEMSAKASKELLKAHAVISRSWLLSQINQKGKNHDKTCGFIENENERIKWYDREDHLNFDVCADDHCQRYQGITKASTPQVREAIKATRGQVLFSDDEVCDARFSKCCGGVLEEFQNCWENTPKPYLKGLADKKAAFNAETAKVVSGNDETKAAGGGNIDAGDNFSAVEAKHKAAGAGDIAAGNLSAEAETKQNAVAEALPDLSIEENARAFILGSPEAFCNTKDKNILSQVLNNYDQETTNFYRWKVEYSISTISELVKKKSGIDFGDIVDLIPVERGVSGRLVRLRIVGTKKTMVIGKELEIRKTLSETHLYSSAFIPEKTSDGFVLYGAGWGHGVGLCQIGAAVMGEKGFKYDEILSHYYPNSEIKSLYK
jgi:SpoIID/LytB domain protein